MNKTRLLGLVLFIAAITCYWLQPFESDFFDFLSGVCGAIGLGMLLGWIKKP